MKKIHLSPYTENNYALVDDQDFKLVSQWKWKYDKHTGYACRNSEVGGHRTVMYTNNRQVS